MSDAAVAPRKMDKAKLVAAVRARGGMILEAARKDGDKRFYAFMKHVLAQAEAGNFMPYTPGRNV